MIRYILMKGGLYMKKIISLLLMLTVIFSCVSTINVFALSDELLINGDFEEGDEESWVLYGNGAMVEVSEDYAHEGDYGMLISERKEKYSTYNQNICETLITSGPGNYKASCWVKLNEELAGKEKCMGYLVIRITHPSTNKATFYTSKQIALTTDWQKCEITANLTFENDGKLSEGRIYPQFFVTQADGNTFAPDIVVDDFSLKKVDAINGVAVEKFEATKVDAISVASAQKSGLASIGAIRWDAWYGHDSSETAVLVQVEKSLSPAKYHWRAPFYASVTDDGKIEIPEYTQEIFDKEMEYAIEAGIDYFAYCWYSDNMKKARVYHTTSKYNKQIKMCAIMDGNSIGQTYCRDEMKILLKQDYYMTVLDGRPLMYYFASSGNLEKIGEDISYYRQLCEKLGIPAPFAVVMNVDAKSVKSVVGDAVSKYGTSGSNGMAFSEFMNKNKQMWDNWASSGIQMVPQVSFGWHPQPRYENPVSWTKVTEDSWVQYATSEECGEALAQGLEYLTSLLGDPLTKANTVLIYGWNEHDEGGWFCPTIAVDKNGNQLYNADGTKKIDTSRIEAVRKVIDSYKAGTLVSNKDTATPTTIASTASPEVTEAPDAAGEQAGTSIWLYVAIGAAVVVGVIVIVVVIKKKKHE